MPLAVEEQIDQIAIDRSLDNPKKSNHQANVIAITEIKPHPDPETTSLELIVIGGYQVVVRKGQFKPGDLGVYIQPDSVVPQTEPFKFIWGPYAEPDYSGDFTGPNVVPERRRRITVRKFRKEWSEGLLLPVTDFGFSATGENAPQVGEDVSDLLGITHYDPDAGKEGTGGPSGHAPKRKFRYPKTFKGWLNFLGRYVWNYLTFRSPKALTVDVPFVLPTYDVEAFKNYTQAFVPFEQVVVTEKIHGSNARFVYLDGVMYAGSRNQWKAPGTGSTWHKALEQNPWIEEWCKANEGYALYGEVTPTQKSKKIDFTYGSKDVQFFVFDIRTPDGKWVDFMDFGQYGVMGLNFVPLLYYGQFIPENIQALVSGPSTVTGAKHLREGIVIKTYRERHVVGLGRLNLKLVSNEFLDKDSQ